VPTPFYHIGVALDLLRHEALEKSIRQRLAGSRCAFLFGNTAPDVQVVAGLPRDATHFFSLPFQMDSAPAWEQFFLEYPQLKQAALLLDEQTAFIAGYLCHLQADWFWVRDIFDPVFGPNSDWGTFLERLYLHNVLRAYIDRQVLEHLSPDIGPCFTRNELKLGLPFIEDGNLNEWRSFLGQQLQPGALSRTVEVFSERQGIDPETFQALLDSEQRMDNEVFIHFPRHDLQSFREMLLRENITLLTNYLS
jgi:hypothetical protein